MGRLWRPSPGIRGAISRLDGASLACGLARLELSRCRLRHGPQQLLANDLWRARGGRGRYRRAVAGECPPQLGAVSPSAGEPGSPLLALSRGSAMDAVALRAAAEQVL